MPLSNTDKQRDFVERQRALGVDEWKEKQRIRKREYRAAKKKQAQDKLNKKPESELKNNSNKISFFDDLLSKIFSLKSKHYKGTKRTITEKTAIAQLKKVDLIYRKMNNTENHMPNLKWVKDIKNVVQFIDLNYKTPNSRVACIKAIASVLQVIPEYETEYKKYSEESVRRNESIRHDLDDNKLNERQENGFLPWAQMKELYKMDNLNEKERVIIGIYTLIAPRRLLDYQQMKITEEKNPKDTKFNYLVVDILGISHNFIFNVYKNAGVIGQIKIDIPNELKKILLSYTAKEKHRAGDMLFKHKTGFSDVVSKTFKKASNKHITLNDIRHSFISHFLNNPKLSFNQKKKMGLKMGQLITSNIQEQYRKI